jgi:hypothetical protein
VGYHSSILVAFAGPEDKLTAFFMKARLDPRFNKAFSDFAWQEGTYGEYAVRFVEEDSTKWYPSYPDVAAMEALWGSGMDSACEELPIFGRFVRIGEESVDVETRSFGDEYGEPCDLGSVCRSIENNIEVKEKVDG